MVKIVCAQSRIHDCNIPPAFSESVSEVSSYWSLVALVWSTVVSWRGHDCSRVAKAVALSSWSAVVLSVCFSNTGDHLTDLMASTDEFNRRTHLCSIVLNIIDRWWIRRKNGVIIHSDRRRIRRRLMYIADPHLSCCSIIMSDPHLTCRIDRRRRRRVIFDIIIVFA